MFNYPVLSQCVVAGGQLYKRPVVLQTGLTWGALWPRWRLLHRSHLVQAGEGLPILSLGTHKCRQRQDVMRGCIGRQAAKCQKMCFLLGIWSCQWEIFWTRASRLSSKTHRSSWILPKCKSLTVNACFLNLETTTWKQCIFMPYEDMGYLPVSRLSCECRRSQLSLAVRKLSRVSDQLGISALFNKMCRPRPFPRPSSSSELYKNI